MKLRNKFLSLAVLSVFVLSSVAGFAQAAGKATHGIVVANIDPAVKPGDDFYHFANGDWLKRTEIPPDRGAIGVFNVLNDLANKRTAGIIEDASKQKAAPGSEAQKVADLYNSYMNEQAIEQAGLKPIEPKLKAISAIQDKQALSRALGETLRADVDPMNNTNYHTMNLFGMWVGPGFDDPNNYHAYLLQGGLVLPDREYYLADTAHMKDLREKYQQHVAAMLKLAGFNDPEARAQRVVELEHAIAEKHLSMTESEDVWKANNNWTQADFEENAPGLEWKQYFEGAGLTNQKQFTVWQPAAFKGESALVASQPLDSWKDWLAFHLIERYAGVLPKAFSDESFNFFGKTLSGTPQQRPRWQRGVNVVDTYLGDAVGQIYAKKYFSPEAKQRAQEMVANIIEAFRKRIDALDWMAPETKKQAKAKLDTLYVGLGYPEKWRDYSKLEIKPNDIFGNVWRANLEEYQYQRDRVGSKVDKHEWSMTPQTVNAVNLPLQNALNFPAAILQPPFFDAQAPAAANYGAIGTVIGHEISHSFDNTGSAFDSEGRLRNWWTPADQKHFEEATQALVKQYDQYAPFPDLHLNGQQTLGENVADVAGLSAAYDGYHASLKGKKAPEQAGYDGDQQFFIAYGQNWATKIRDASLRRQVMTDPHSPGEYRADTVRNIDAWYNAFKVPDTAKLYLAPNQRVRIW